MLTKHFRPRDQFRNRMALVPESDKSKKCFVKRQEFVIINEPGEKKKASTVGVRKRNGSRTAKDETTSTQTWNLRINTRD